ncbi:hypothetical protein B0T19DRAFT_425138 [Cercophora scortea]|uniref:Uncharacterized protein n=1 Tax=Cercophora scortea TaxID=314031 RepID=A0AAE0IP03_9PEZI|nr:hypothetical protein B0T19DRAFT_425138 [Cercophora scortea]
MAQFLKRVFSEGWNTQKPYQPPTSLSLSPRTTQTRTHVGRLRMPGFESFSHVLYRGWHVHLRPAPGTDGQLHFHVLDGDFNAVNPAIGIRWRPGLSATEGYLTAMDRHDKRQYITIGGYNLAWGVFHARGRLVHWANNEESPGEDLQGRIVDLKLCRRCTTVAPPEAENALALLRDEDPPVFLDRGSFDIKPY